jgi:hypothetical protein
MIRGIRVIRVPYICGIRVLKRTSVAAIALLAVLCAGVGEVRAQFLDSFDHLHTDSEGLQGWASFAGDGEATVTFQQREPGTASILVDATRDRRNIWWALIKRQVSDSLDLQALGRPGYGLRVEARIRVSHAPRRVNLHVNTQRTTDFHSHLMEYDIPEAGTWHTISMTTRDFDVRPGDTIFAQLALMDWGRDRYRVDIDEYRATVVELATAAPDAGEAVAYHPAIPDPRSFAVAVPVAHDSTIDAAHPGVNLNAWSEARDGRRASVIGVGGTLNAVLRFDLSRFAGRRVVGSALLEVTTRSVQRSADEMKDFGLIRVVEILGGDGEWDQKTVTADSLRAGSPPDRIFNTQMIIDWPAAEREGARTYFTIPRPVLQRLVDGRTKGLALMPLGSIMASFYGLEDSGGQHAARLLFDVK